MNTRIFPVHTRKNGIEYYGFPPPCPLFKAMNRQYADALTYKGQIRLGHTDYYRSLAKVNFQESDHVGGQSDKQEGLAILLDNDNPVTTEGILHTYIFCLSTSDADHSYLLGLDPSYDTIIRINDPHAFGVRLLQATKCIRSSHSLEAGKVLYNKGNAELPAKDCEIGLSLYYNFQKGEIFKSQHEYRFAMTDLGHQCVFEEFMNLDLGSCEGLVEVIVSK